MLKHGAADLRRWRVNRFLVLVVVLAVVLVLVLVLDLVLVLVVLMLLLTLQVLVQVLVFGGGGNGFFSAGLRKTFLSFIFRVCCNGNDGLDLFLG